MLVKKTKGFIKKILIQTSILLSPYPRIKKAYLFILPSFLADWLEHFQGEQHKNFKIPQNKPLSPREEILYRQCIGLKQAIDLKGKK